MATNKERTLGLPKMVHGKRIMRLVFGNLPAKMRRQASNVLKYRRTLEDLVYEKHGKVNATAAHLIDEACQAERHAAVCRWLLRTRMEEMTAGDIARCSEGILKAATVRNKAIERLKLDDEPIALPWIEQASDEQQTA